ncbi:uncharacterized protein LOC128109329 [Peromyscus californicus insignis]|uniref:uncharacterized protein LOC128109329 n=1 Tax=Peromyscus californicus insignis TaxID=564181 RepID=UPI0022A6C4D4|nr:uncharacterized protein LOC128109329 [Peromyscus californicus insignis]
MSEYKTIVLLKGLEGLNDYQFRTIKSLLRKKLNLTEEMQENYDRIQMADLMEKKIPKDAGLDLLINLCESMNDLEDLAKKLKTEKAKVKKEKKRKNRTIVKKGKQEEPSSSQSLSTDNESDMSKPSAQKKRKQTTKTEGGKKMKLTQEQTQLLAPSGSNPQKDECCLQTPHKPPPTPSSSSSNKTPKKGNLPKEPSMVEGHHQDPIQVMVLKVTEPFTYDLIDGKRMFHATVATETEFFRVKVFDTTLKNKFIPKKIIAVSDYFGVSGFLEIYRASCVSDDNANQTLVIPNTLRRRANGTPKIKDLFSQTKGTYVNGEFVVTTKNERGDFIYYGIEDDTGKMEVVVSGRLTSINCEPGNKLRLFSFELTSREDTWQLKSVKHSYMQVLSMPEGEALNPDSVMKTSVEPYLKKRVTVRNLPTYSRLDLSSTLYDNIPGEVETNVYSPQAKVQVQLKSNLRLMNYCENLQDNTEGSADDGGLAWKFKREGSSIIVEIMSEYKTIVLQQGLEDVAVDDYQFRKIKSLLRKELKLTKKMQDDYDRIQIADLMEDTFPKDAGLDVFINVCESIEELEDLAERLRTERAKVKRRKQEEPSSSRSLSTDNESDKSEPSAQTLKWGNVPKEPSKVIGHHQNPKEVMVLKVTEPFTYDLINNKRMFHATVATETEFFRVKVFDTALKNKFIPQNIIAISDYFGISGFLEIYGASCVSDVNVKRTMIISNTLRRRANGTPKIKDLFSQIKGTYVNGEFVVTKKNERNDFIYYGIEDNTGKMEVVVSGRLTSIKCEPGNKVQLICFQLTSREDTWQLKSVKHSYMQVSSMPEGRSFNPDSVMNTSLEPYF